MNKKSLVNKLQSEVKLSKTQSEKVFSSVFERIKESIKVKRYFNVDGFGNFKVERRKMQTMVDYNKKAVVLLPPKEKIVFYYDPSENTTSQISEEVSGLIKSISAEHQLDEIKVYNYFIEIFNTLKINFQKDKNVNISEFGKFKPKGGNLNFSPVKKFAEDVNYYFSDLKTVTVRALSVSEFKSKFDTKPLPVSTPKAFIREEEDKVDIKIKERYDVRQVIEPEKEVFVAPVIEKKAEPEIIPEPEEIVFEDFEDIVEEMPPVVEEVKEEVVEEVKEEVVEEVKEEVVEEVKEEVVEEVKEEIVEEVKEEVVDEVKEEVVDEVKEEVVDEVKEEVVDEVKEEVVEEVKEEVVDEVKEEVVDEVKEEVVDEVKEEVVEEVKEEVVEEVKEEIVKEEAAKVVDKIVDDAVEEIQSGGDITDINEEIRRRTELFKQAERKFDTIHFEDTIPAIPDLTPQVIESHKVSEPIVNKVEPEEHLKTPEEIADDFELKVKKFESEISKTDFVKSFTEIKEDTKPEIEGIERPSILNDTGIMKNPFETESNEPPSALSDLVIPPFFADEKIEIPKIDSEITDFGSAESIIPEFKTSIVEEPQQDTFITPDAKIKFVKEEEETLSIGDMYEKLRDSFSNGDSVKAPTKEEETEPEKSNLDDIIEETVNKPKDIISYEINSEVKEEENTIESKTEEKELETETERPPVMNELSETKIMPPPGASEKFEEEFKHFFNTLKTEPIPATTPEPPQPTVEPPVINEIPKSLDDYLETTTPPTFEPFDPGVKEVEKAREEERNKIFNATPPDKVTLHHEEEQKEEKKLLGLPLYAIISAIIILTIIIGGIFMYKSFVEKVVTNVNPPIEEQQNP